MNFLGLLVGVWFVADGPRYEAVVASNEKTIAGELVSLAVDGTATVGSDTIKADDLIELRQVGATRPLPPFDRAHVLLNNGDRWLGNVLGIKDDQVTFAAELGSRQQVTLPASQLSAAWLVPPKTNSEFKSIDFDDVKRQRRTDEVHLVNGDVVRGAITSLNPSELTVEVSGTARQLPRERVAGIAFGSDPLRPSEAKGPMAKIVLTNGARLSMAGAKLQDGRLVGQAIGGNEVRVLLADVIHLAIVGGKAQYLSELTPSKYEFTPYFSIQWPLAINRNSAGGWMQLGPHAFDRGLGMHSQSLTRFAIPPGSARFESWVGLDSRVGARGRVVVTVRIDDKSVFGPVEMAAADAPRWISVPISASGRELALIVEFGPGADVQDHVNWADARLIQGQKKR